MASNGQVIHVAAGTYTEAAIAVNKGVTIEGAGAKSTTIQAHASYDSASNRVFNVTSTANVTIRNMTIRHGKTSSSGGGIFMQPASVTTCEFTIDSCEIVDNISNAAANYAAGGGGVFATYSDNASTSVTVTLLNCTVSGNGTTSRGGGAFFCRGGNNGTLNLIMRNCTVSGNTASGSDGQTGGGIAIHNHGMTITNSTITGNASTNASGGGGGIAQRYGSLTLTSSILAGNSSAGDEEEDFARNSVTLTESKNLVGINESGSSDFTSGSPNANGSYIGTIASPLNAEIDALADNGGQTRTCAPQSDSLAIDHGSNPASLEYDQRGSGYARIVNGTADIGAFEKQTGATTYTVSYDGNGSTGGTAPVDASSPYADGATVTVLGNSGSLVKTDSTFNNWNTAADGSGTSYAPSATFTINADTTLYAQWMLNSISIVTDVSSLNVVEGSTNTFQVKLSSAPASEVTVNVARFSGDTTLSVSGGSSLVFTSANFASWQTATLSAAHDDADYSNGAAVIRCSGTSLSSTDVDASVLDDDAMSSVVEDAEDMDAEGWRIYYRCDVSDSVQNAVDPDDGSNRCIMVSGKELSTGAEYIPSAPITSKILSMRIRFAERFWIMAVCSTSEGQFNLWYSPEQDSRLASGSYIHHGLGLAARSGGWIKVVRNVEGDIRAARPSADFISIDSFYFFGSGLVDDITGMTFPDADQDGMADFAEDDAGLNMNSRADMASDLDSDGIRNDMEAANGTAPDLSDTDADGLSDFFEMFRDGGDPLVSDANADADADGYAAFQERDNLTHPSRTLQDRNANGTAYKIEEHSFYNAEDGSTRFWQVSFRQSPSDSVSNVADPVNPAGRVISCSGDNAGFTFHLPPASQEFRMRWRMANPGSYTIFFECLTSAGFRYLWYSPEETDRPASGAWIHHGLGVLSRSSSMQVFSRDLRADLKDAEPSEEILFVNSMTVFGSCLLDDICAVGMLDSDRDGIPDSVETAAGLNPSSASDAKLDKDGDGLSNIDEFLLGTDISDTDSDNDGLSDFFEVRRTGTDPNLADSDTDGTADGAEDPDTDGSTNLQEQAAGSDPLVKGSGSVELVTYEDAEDAAIDGWTVVYRASVLDKVENIQDPDDASNRCISLSGQGLSTGSQFLLAPPNSGMRKVQWRMRFSESFWIFVACQTSGGARELWYSDDSRSLLGSGRYVHHGLGCEARTGEWTTFRRDLQSDLEAAHPGETITAVESILVFGSGMLDDIAMMSYPDTDGDMIPDSLEGAGTTPDGDEDSDGILNYREVINGTDINDADSDNDGLSDFFEIFASRTNPASGDDSAADPDGDTKSNLQEQADKTMPRMALAPSTDGYVYGWERDIREDAEDGLTTDWSVYFRGNVADRIENAVDPDNGANKCIQLIGTGTSSGFRFALDPASIQRKLEWRMRFSGSYCVAVFCHTTKGLRAIYYYPSDTSPGLSGDYVQIGIGSDTASGSWVKIRRDLQKDIETYDPGTKFISACSVFVFGSGYVDDISLMTYKDGDADLIPDDVEILKSLDPDTLDPWSTVRQFLNGTL
jgi:hypothetical protein